MYLIKAQSEAVAETWTPIYCKQVCLINSTKSEVFQEDFRLLPPKYLWAKPNISPLRKLRVKVPFM